MLDQYYFSDQITCEARQSYLGVGNRDVECGFVESRLIALVTSALPLVLSDCEAVAASERR